MYSVTKKTNTLGHGSNINIDTIAILVNSEVGCHNLCVNTVTMATILPVKHTKKYKGMIYAIS